MAEQTFELKEDHLKLLKKAYWSWNDCEYGAPEIDPKRPYGNSSVLQDIAEILGEEQQLCPHCGEPLDELDYHRYNELHKELETALRIIHSLQTFQTGLYARTTDYSNNWKLVKAS